MRTRMTPALASILLLAACAGDPAPEAAPTTEPEPDPITSLEDLQTAYVTAGGTCDTLSSRGVVKAALDSGHCDDGAVLSIYSDTDGPVEAVTLLRSITEGTDIEHTLVWSSVWLVNVDGNVDAGRALAETYGADSVGLD